MEKLGKTDKNKISRPAALLYTVGRAAVSGFVHAFCGYSSSGEQQLPQGALMVVCGHAGMLDFALTAAAFKKRRLHFVSSDNYFRVPVLRRALRAVGTIPKIQFHPDPRCIIHILHTIRRGDSVCIFPAGQTSICGEPTYIDPAIVRLLRKSGAPIVTAAYSGGFFTFSRFSGLHFNRGKCHVELKLLFTPEQMKSLSDEEIYDKLCAAISFDDYAWQERTGVQFKNSKRATGFDNLLFLCPKCGEKFTISVKNNDIFCSNCGCIATVGTDMHIHGEGIPKTLIEWHHLQERDFASSVAGGLTALKFDTAIAAYNGKKFAQAGHGTVSVTADGVSYSGTISGAQTSLFVGYNNLAGLSTTLGSYIEIFFEDRGALRFYPDNPCDVVRAVIAQKHFSPKISAI